MGVVHVFLFLSNNRIGDIGAKAIAEMLRVNTGIEKLELVLMGLKLSPEALSANRTLKIFGI